MVATLSPTINPRINQRKHHERLTDKQIEFIQAFRETGITYAQINEIAINWNKHPDTIYYQVKRWGVALRKAKRVFHPQELRLIEEVVFERVIDYHALLQKVNQVAVSNGREPLTKKALYSKVSTIRIQASGQKRIRNSPSKSRKKLPIKPRFQDPISIAEISEYIKVSEKVIEDWITLCPEIIRTGFLDEEFVISRKSFRDFALQYPGEIEKFVPGSFGLLTLLDC